MKKQSKIKHQNIFKAKVFRTKKKLAMPISKKAPNISGYIRNWAVALDIQQWIFKNMHYVNYGQRIQWIFDHLEKACWDNVMLYA